MSQSNALHAFVAHTLTPRQLAEFMAKTELRLREQTQRSVFHEAKAPEKQPVDQDQDL